MSNEYNAESLLNIARYYGDDITPDQNEWLANEVDNLPDSEQSDYFDTLRAERGIEC